LEPAVAEREDDVAEGVGAAAGEEEGDGDDGQDEGVLIGGESMIGTDVGDHGDQHGAEGEEGGGSDEDAQGDEAPPDGLGQGEQETPEDGEEGDVEGFHAESELVPEGGATGEEGIAMDEEEGTDAESEDTETGVQPGWI